MIFMFFDLNFFSFDEKFFSKEKKIFLNAKSRFHSFLLVFRVMDYFFPFVHLNCLFEALWFVPHDNPSFFIVEIILNQKLFSHRIKKNAVWSSTELHNWLCNFYIHSTSLSKLFTFIIISVSVLVFQFLFCWHLLQYVLCINVCMSWNCLIVVCCEVCLFVYTSYEAMRIARRKKNSSLNMFTCRVKSKQKIKTKQ